MVSPKVELMIKDIEGKAIPSMSAVKIGQTVTLITPGESRGTRFTLTNKQDLTRAQIISKLAARYTALSYRKPKAKL